MRRFVVVLIILLIILFGGTFIVWRQLPQLVSYVISKQTKTHVHINSIRFGIDEIHLETLVIDSPENASIKRALKVEDITIKAPFTAYARTPVIIPSVTLNDIYLGIEFYNKNRTKGNWVTIMNNINGEDAEEKKKESDVLLQKEQNYGLIQDLTLNQLNIELKLFNESPVKLSTIPTVTFKDVRTDNGQISEELTQIIIKKMMYSVFIMKGIQTVINLPKDVIDTVIWPFTWFGGGNKKKDTSSNTQNTESGAQQNSQ